MGGKGRKSQQHHISAALCRWPETDLYSLLLIFYFPCFLFLLVLISPNLNFLPDSSAISFSNFNVVMIANKRNHVLLY